MHLFKRTFPARLVIVCHSVVTALTTTAVIVGVVITTTLCYGEGRDQRGIVFSAVQPPCLATACMTRPSKLGSRPYITAPKDAFMATSRIGWPGRPAQTEDRVGRRRARNGAVVGVARQMSVREEKHPVRGLWMKANKKNKRKREKRLEEDGDGDGGGAPQRVTKNAPISVRAQIKYAKMRKTLEKGSGAKTVPNTYRRVKPRDYDDIVEQEDLSKVYMPDIAPSLMVDGYNILHYWPKTSMIAAKGDLEGARVALLDQLDALAAMRGWTVTAVFDAHSRKGGNREYVTPNEVRVVFTEEGESADMYVERETMGLKDAGCPNVMVATGDRLMQALVSEAGAEVFSPNRIIEEIEVSQKEAAVYSEMYIRRKEQLTAKSDMQNMLNSVRHIDKGANQKKRTSGGGTGSGGRGGRDERRKYSIEEDFGLL